jgi:hypothetical protein
MPQSADGRSILLDVLNRRGGGDAMATGCGTLRLVAIVLNALSVVWWIWTAARVTSNVGTGAVLSSGALLWVAFVVPPLAAIVVMVRCRNTSSPLSAALNVRNR